MPRMSRRGAASIRRGALAAIVCALLGAPACAQAGGGPEHLLYEWMPGGEGDGPQLVLEEKEDLSGKFGVQCGKDWYYAIFGGGGERDPWTISSSGALSGTGEFPGGSVGKGSSYRNSEIDFFDFKSAGPVSLTLSGTANDEAAVGTLSLKVYSYTKARKVHGHKVKRKKVLSASCAIPFNAPNHYAPEAPSGSEEQAPAPAE
jgi:hypothetical protein